MTLGLKFLLYINGKIFHFKKCHSNIMDFQLEQMSFCKVVDKDVSITIDLGRIVVTI